MKLINERCNECDSKIDPYEFFINNDGSNFFCSEKCCKQYYNRTHEELFIYKSICSGYDECHELNNISERCKTEKELRMSQYGFPQGFKQNRCLPSEISIIRTNMKLYNFVKQSEEQSSKLNEKTVNLTKFNVNLTIAMLLLAAINAIGIIVQIWLQMSSGG
ncbi:hypothetical protein [uncultured Methanobrevibacter sp.]|uniref:hypothetical protein n=1 Tax=uncultured Methanobrevibacter sp. TaxID=253161 RepID=UPI0026001686|nr:hypothetical protein [uncultured Methanobrevibacter sp.]